jgi:hypothetical protein
VRFNICTLNNAHGLGIDRALLWSLLESWGHEVHGVDIEGPNNPLKAEPAEIPEVDVNIFLELVSQRLLSLNKARYNWLVPNQEWFHHDWLRLLPTFDKILCKTKESVRAFSEAGHQGRCVHTGWESRDLFDPTVPRKRQFLHVAGGSDSKNSLSVAYAFLKFFSSKLGGGPWNTNRNAKIIFVSHDGALREYVEAGNQGNCIFIERASDEELKYLMNESIFHVMPSKAEGWGHVIHEGLGCGAVMITTDFPPMNEYAGIERNLRARPVKDWVPMGTIGRQVWIGAYEVKTVIDVALGLTSEKIQAIQENARKAFLAQRDEFRLRLMGVIDDTVV